MILLRGSHKHVSINKPCVATIGNFDGFHLGHQQVCKYVLEQAHKQQASSVLISFVPTAKEFFEGEQAPPRIYPLRKKLELARDFGFDYFVCLNFNHCLAKLPAVDFVKQILHDSLKIKSLVVGDDFKFGHKRGGNIHLLRETGNALGFEVHSQSAIGHQRQRVSSTLIREKLAQGDFEQAAILMGRPFTISGRVFHGDKKGRTIGFPTANIILRLNKPPINGVFAVAAKTNKGAWQGVANIGIRPTVNGKRLQLETHLFNCQQNLYGQRLEIEFISKLREEIKFSSLDELKQQIVIDVELAKELFSQRM